MELLSILVIVVIISLYFAPFMFVSLRITFPFIFKMKNTIIFGLIGILYSQNTEPFPILNVFVGMIAGSLIDLLLKDNN